MTKSAPRVSRMPEKVARHTLVAVERNVVRFSPVSAIIAGVAHKFYDDTLNTPKSR